MERVKKKFYEIYNESNTHVSCTNESSKIVEYNLTDSTLNDLIDEHVNLIRYSEHIADRVNELIEEVEELRQAKQKKWWQFWK